VTVGSELYSISPLLRNACPLYNVARAFTVHGPLDESALRQALEAIIARHEVLRTTFTAEDGDFVQAIGELRAVPLSVI
jgi:hypothetical protein